MAILLPLGMRSAVLVKSNSADKAVFGSVKGREGGTYIPSIAIVKFKGLPVHRPEILILEYQGKDCRLTIRR